MSYEVIEKNEYGVLVRNNTTEIKCCLCKYATNETNRLPCNMCAKNAYYLYESQAAKLETENLSICSVQPMPTDTGISSTEYTGDYNQQYSACIENSDSQKELIDLQIENKQLKERINELENTIENMKAIAGEKIESIGSITSVDYTSDNTTELIEVFSNESGYVMQCNSCKEKHSTDFQSKFNFCPNCGRKIVRN